MRVGRRWWWEGGRERTDGEWTSNGAILSTHATTCMAMALVIREVCIGYVWTSHTGALIEEIRVYLPAWPRGRNGDRRTLSDGPASSSKTQRQTTAWYDMADRMTRAFKG